MLNTKKLLSTLLSTFLFITAAGCGGSNASEIPPTPPPITPPATSTPIPQPTAWPTNTPPPTATLSPTETPLPDLTATWQAENVVDLDIEFNYEGVFVNYSNKLYSELVPGREPALAQGYLALPEYQTEIQDVPYNIALRGKNKDASRETLIGVQTIVDESGFFYSTYSMEDQEYFNELRRVSITRPRLDFFYEADDFVLDAKYTDFKNGKGISSIRYLPTVDGPEEITNEQLFYTFEGITNSGFFYVWLQYPIQVDALSDQKSFTDSQLDVLASDASNFAIYKLNEMEQVRRSLEKEEVNPQRSILNDLVGTIFVSDMAGGAIAVVEATDEEGQQGEQGQADPEVANEEASAQEQEEPQGEDNPEIPGVEDPEESADVDTEPEDVVEAEPTPEEVPTEEPTSEPDPTETPLPTETPEPTETPAPAEPTPEPTEAATATPEPIQEATATPEPVEEETPIPPEPTQVVGAVPTYDPSCINFLNYLEDVTIPDYAKIDSGSEFEKTWKVENKGSCPITSEFEIIVTSDPGVTVVSLQPMQTINPGDSGLLTITLRAPDTAGTFGATAALRAPDGTKFGQLFAIFVSQ